MAVPAMHDHMGETPMLRKKSKRLERYFHDLLRRVDGEEAGAREAGLVAAGEVRGRGWEVADVFVGERDDPGFGRRRGGLDIQRRLAEQFAAVGDDRQVSDAGGAD